MVTVNAPLTGLDSLPYDLLRIGRRLSFSLGDLFATLSYPVVAALERADLDALYQAQIQHAPKKALGENASKDFILRYVFEITPELIKQPADLLRVLLRRHYRGQHIPRSLDERFIQRLERSGCFQDWPLATIVPEREAFFAFLQERWPVFLDHWLNQASKNLRDSRGDYPLQYPGPAELPFAHDDVHIYIDDLFLEGWLRPVPHQQAAAATGTWIVAGLQTNDPKTDRLRRLDGLLGITEASLPAVDARHDAWLRFAYQWAELVCLQIEAGAGLPSDYQQRFTALRVQVDAAFLAWLQNRYASLHNQPPLPPVMLHHIPRALARQLSTAQAKIAFILVDGLTLDQWLVIRTALHKQRADLRYHEQAVFAWIPTITSVSRQAAFAGKPPIYFPASLYTTNKEAAHWSAFWMDSGLQQRQIIYAKGLGDGDLAALAERLSHPQVRVAGLIIDTVDKIMHGMQLGSAGMHNQVRQWTEQGYLATLFSLLLENGFQIWLSSDHGNIEASGCGRPTEGAAAELRGERVRVFANERLRASVQRQFPDTIAWPPIGLPLDYLPLLAPGRQAFIRERETLVGHGGISLEEVIVPLIRIECNRASTTSP